MNYPKMRPVNAFPAKMSGQNVICLQDPFKYSPKAVFVPEPAFFIISLLDGNHSLPDIQEQFMKRYGELLHTEQLEKVISDLDSAFFLDNERFSDFKKDLEEEFEKMEIRKPHNNGISYNTAPQKLKEELKGYLSFQDHASPSSLKKKAKNIKGIISPHIDFPRGKMCYGTVYNQIKDNTDTELFLIFGTSHLPTKNLFTLTRKSFETPMGIIDTDKDFIDTLGKNYAGNLFEDELVHKTEHSIEFQVVFLKYLFNPKIKIVPILCGSFFEMSRNKTSPSSVPEFSDFIKALKKTVSQYGKKVLMIAGADLAHIGPQFGDPDPVNPSTLQELEKEDRAMLDFLKELKTEEFSRDIQKDNDRRHICGYPCIYTMLSAIKAKKGTLLKYEQTTDPQTHSTVSFASMIFTG
jgi:MEMO1 family protein